MKEIFRIFAVALILVSSSVSLAVENKSAQDQPAVSQVQQVVNINTADAETLTNLKGVGIKKAEAIIAWREANGGFTSVEQLLEVKGIGVAILDENRNSLRIE
ncbi:MAG: ComEA family DNA-binding protein [Cellvibrio sp.]